jgi:hypothetical protein
MARLAHEAITLEPDLGLASWSDADRLFRGLREALVAVEQPLVLVSQVQRSGGTLMAGLLDGHPELHAHPHELHIGHPTKHDWPVLELAAGPDAWFDQLAEPFVGQLFEHGYLKTRPVEKAQEIPTPPFTIVPSFLERLFRLLCAERPPQSRREVLDRYFTAFFNSWLDYQGLRETPKRWVTAFCPRLVWGEGRARFEEDYPTGRIVVVHRDPRAWYASASRHTQAYAQLDVAIPLWRQSAEEALRAKAERGEGVLLVTYEALAEQLERVMYGLADWLGIERLPCLLQPTFNRQPVHGNSSHRVYEPGVHRESVTHWRELLDPHTVARIESQCLGLDETVRAVADVA